MKLSRQHFAYIIDCYIMTREKTTIFTLLNDLRKELGLLLGKLEDDNSNFNTVKAIHYIEKKHGIKLY